MLNRLGRKIEQWRVLEQWERKALLGFACLLPFTWLGLRVLGFKRMHRLSMSPVATCQNDQPERAQRYAALMAIAAGHGLYQANCLHQALPLCWYLRRRGLPAQHKIGVKPDLRDFQAHAWVELEGVPLGQSVVEYQTFGGAHRVGY